MCIQITLVTFTIPLSDTSTNEILEGVHFGTISTSCALFGSIMYTFARKRMQQNTDMVQSATPDGFVSELRRLVKSTDTTPLAYVVESLT